MSLVNVEGLTFKNERVVFDGKRYVGCKFVRCTLVYSGGDWSWDKCSFDDCSFSFEGAAQRTLAFVKYLEVVGGMKIQGQTPPKGAPN